MRIKLFSSAMLLTAIIPLSIGLSSCSNEEGVVNTKDDYGSEVIGKFNCNTGEAKLTKDDWIAYTALKKINGTQKKTSFQHSRQTTNFYLTMNLNLYDVLSYDITFG